MNTLIENYKLVKLLAVQDIASATTTDGTGVDCVGLGNDVLVIVSYGTMTGVHTCNVKMQESAVLGSGYADVTGAAFTETNADSDDKTASLGFKRTKQFIRVEVVTAGTVTANVIGVVALVAAEQQHDGVNSKTAA